MLCIHPWLSKSGPWTRNFYVTRELVKKKMEKRKEEEEEGKKEEKERKGEEEGNKKLKANFESRHNESKLGFGFLL